MPRVKRGPVSRKRTSSKGSVLLHGIPLKRKVVWVYDTESPEFKALWAKERRVLRQTPSDPEIDQFLEAAWQDIDRALDHE
jgi:hypothetical protein